MTGSLTMTLLSVGGSERTPRHKAGRSMRRAAQRWRIGIFEPGGRLRLAPIPTGRWHGLGVRSDEQITGHRTLPLDLNRAALSQLETVS